MSNPNKEGANKFGENGFFDYLRQLPSSKLLILELKIQNQQKKFDAYDKNQHHLLCALSNCGLPIRYAWNTNSPSQIERDFLNAILLEMSSCVECTEFSGSKSETAKKVASLLTLKDYIDSLLDETTVQAWSERHNQLLGLLGCGVSETNATTVLLCLIVGNSNEFLLLNEDDLKMIAKEIKSLELPIGWQRQQLNDLTNEITLLVGTYIQKAEMESSQAAELDETKEAESVTHSRTLGFGL